MDITNLKSNWELEIESDQKKGVEIPPYQKAPAEGAKRISLPESDFSEHRGSDLVDVILHRRSERKYTDEGLSLAELNWLLFATQGVQQAMNRGSFRPSPSAGARHPFESYIAVFDVAGIEPGLYRYLPYDNELELIEQSDDLRQRAQEALNGQGGMLRYSFSGPRFPTGPIGDIRGGCRNSSPSMRDTCVRICIWPAAPSVAVPAESARMIRNWETGF
jgi:hypothetical protein